MVCNKCNIEHSFWDLYLVTFTHKGFKYEIFVYKIYVCAKCMGWKK